MNYSPDIENIEEIERLQTLLSYNILDTPNEDDFDSLVKLISIICDSPIALISLIDEKRQWFKAKVGLPGEETPIEETICQHTMGQEGLLEIPDTRLDDRVKNNPHVLAGDGIRFYAGIPLKASNGHNIGTVCVVDTQPKELTITQREALQLLTDQAMMLLNARKKNRELSEELEEILNNKVKDTERKFQQINTEYNRLLKAIKKSNGVVEFSPDGTVLTANSIFLDFFGYQIEEVLGNHHRMFLSPEDYDTNDEFWKSLGKGNHKAGRLKRQHKDKSPLWLQVTYNPILDMENKVVKIIKIAQNITAEKKAEKALQDAKDLADTLSVQKDHFIANVSHEMRTPIHAILGFTELILEQEKDLTKKTYLKSVKTAGDNLLFIINDILDLSKIEAGVIQMAQEPFELKKVIESVFSILHLKAHQKKIDFIYHLEPSTPTILIGDKDRLSQILINLLGNAIKFTSSGSVELFVTPLKNEPQHSSIEFKVKDTGIGIPENKLDHIFHRFSQAEADTSRKYGGTGLGLNISTQLIEKQHGTIEVKSEVGKGATFRFILPYKIDNTLKIPHSKPQVTWKIQNKKARLLICEDNELNQSLIKAILKEKGFEAHIADNGNKAIALYRENSYDLIFMDLQMPEKNGYETTKFLRGEIGSRIPIIALTANSLVAERQKCLDVGMNDYLSKPFTKEDLLSIINKWLGISENIAMPARTPKVASPMLNLQVLEEFSGGDLAFQKEMIKTFKEQAGIMLIEIHEHFEKKNFTAISAVAHKLKTSFGILGADISTLNKLEHLSAQVGDETSILNTISTLRQQLEEINQILATRF